jgi:cytoskeletal protein RodZ
MSLEALERSDLSRLPGGIFTRSFIRAYAQEVGLDPDRTIQDFIAELPPETATATVRPVAMEDGEKLESDRRAVTTAFRLVMMSAPIVGLVIYYGSQRAPAEFQTMTTPAIEAPSAKPVAPPISLEPVAVAAEPPSAPAAPPPAATPVSGLTMAIMPRAACWVSVNADGERVFSGLMNGGETRVVTAKEQIVVNVGDAAAFDYTLNGRPGKALGAPGEVVSKRITLSNLNDFVTP